jgi:uncharacterized protein involved in copper resistance
MMYRNRKALPWIGASLTLAGALALSACNSKDNETTPAATPSAVAADTATATEGAAAAASGTPGADDAHNRMERDQRRDMDHDSMRMGPGMNRPASPTPGPQSTDQNSPMPSGGMQDM